MNNPKHYSCGDENHNEDLTFTLKKLSLLQPGQVDDPQPAAHALTRIKRTIKRDVETSARPSRPVTDGFLRRLLSMNNRRLATAVAALVLFFAVALTFPSVRAAASDFFSLFRVQKFAAVSVSPQQIAMLEQFAAQGMMPGEITMIHESSPPPVDTLRDAAIVLGRDVKTIDSLGQPQGVFLNGEARMAFVVDLDSSRAILEAVGADPASLPDSLDGQTIEGTVATGVHQHWSDGVHLVEMPSPQVVYPAELQPQLIGEAMLQLLGMSPAEAARLSRDIDWTNTLILPIPQEMATFHEVTINGSSGLALNSLNGQENSLIWQQDGYIYLLTSPRHTPAELLRLAQSIQ